MKFLLALILSFSTYIIRAQDVILKRNGETISAKVLEITETTLRYKNWDNMNGPDYLISKDLVKEVRYENGTVDFFELNLKQRLNTLNYDSLMRISRKKRIYGIVALSISGTAAVTGISIIVYNNSVQTIGYGLGLFPLGFIICMGAIPGAIIGPIQLYKAKKYERLTGNHPSRPRLSLPDVGFNRSPLNNSFGFSVRTTLTF